MYTDPISITQTTTIQAMAAASGMADSDVASATYTIQVATPAFNPPDGTYTGSVTVTIGVATGGATIYYTTDGTTPTSSSPVYTDPIAITETTTIQAMAAADGMADSDVASATYTIQPATPTLSPAGESCVRPQKVRLVAFLRWVVSALYRLLAMPSEGQ